MITKASGLPLAEAVSENRASLTYTYNHTVFQDVEPQLIDVAEYAAFMLATASTLKELGFEYYEALSRYYDALSYILKRVPGDYVRGSIIDAANKAHDPIALIESLGEEYIRNILTYLVSDACNKEVTKHIFKDLVSAFGVKEESISRIEIIIDKRDCATVKRTLLLLLSTPPTQG